MNRCRNTGSCPGGSAVRATALYPLIEREPWVAGSIPARGSTEGLVYQSLEKRMRLGHLLFSSAVHFSMSCCRLTFSVFTMRPALRAPVRMWCNVSWFLQAVGWSHSLQSSILLLEAQARISQFALPSPFLHPRHNGISCIDVSPFMNSLKSKSFGRHPSSPYALMISSYLFVSSFRVPLPTTQLPHQIPQKPI